jgi:hypothetical protein
MIIIGGNSKKIGENPATNGIRDGIQASALRSQRLSVNEKELSA